MPEGVGFAVPCLVIQVDSFLLPESIVTGKGPSLRRIRT